LTAGLLESVKVGLLAKTAAEQSEYLWVLWMVALMVFLMVE